MRVLIYSFVIVLIDQITKLVVKGFSIPFLDISVEGMNYGQSIKVIGNFFKITFVENPGMAFGIGVGSTSKFFLSLFSLIASIGIVVYIYKMRHEKFIFRLGLALILGGAIGNLIDRTFYGVFFDYAPLMYGKVVDFFNVEFFDFTIFGKTYQRWPIFNVADMSVSFGVVILLFVNHKVNKKEDEQLTVATADDNAVVGVDELTLETEEDRPIENDFIETQEFDKDIDVDNEQDNNRKDSNL